MAHNVSPTLRCINFSSIRPMSAGGRERSTDVAISILFARGPFQSPSPSRKCNVIKVARLKLHSCGQLPEITVSTLFIPVTSPVAASFKRLGAHRVKNNGLIPRVTLRLGFYTPGHYDYFILRNISRTVLITRRTLRFYDFSKIECDFKKGRSIYIALLKRAVLIYM